uniref:NADH:quinone oxidoreductase/Mrp antiporter transmembrane domain-containing protein n=1 Tax=Solanum lycopersicum TaxID=4081 RepID=K4D2Q3_SOLLC
MAQLSIFLVMFLIIHRQNRYKRKSRNGQSAQEFRPLIRSMSGHSVSVFHLMNHAFFKALLFLSAGSVIHAMSDEQDMRKMGGLASSFPFTYAMMLMGSLSLIGFPLKRFDLLVRKSLTL